MVTRVSSHCTLSSPLWIRHLSGHFGPSRLSVGHWPPAPAFAEITASVWTQTPSTEPPLASGTRRTLPASRAALGTSV